MYDLHSHLLPGIDDGASDYDTSLAMARIYADQGVQCVACTPHILPGLYQNSGPQIKAAVAELQQRLDDAAIPLQLVSGADNHIIPDFVESLKQGRLLPLGNSCYVLVEPPHHIAPARLEDLFFNILLGGYIPILNSSRKAIVDRKQIQCDDNACREGGLDATHIRIADWEVRQAPSLLGSAHAGGRDCPNPRNRCA